MPCSVGQPPVIVGQPDWYTWLASRQPPSNQIWHRQIQVRKQISIRCNRIEHWVRLGSPLTPPHHHNQNRHISHFTHVPPEFVKPKPNPVTHPAPSHIIHSSLESHMHYTKQLNQVYHPYTHSLQPHQHCRHPHTLTVSQHTHMHKK